MDDGKRFCAGCGVELGMATMFTLAPGGLRYCGSICLDGHMALGGDTLKQIVDQAEGSALDVVAKRFGIVRHPSGFAGPEPDVMLRGRVNGVLGAKATYPMKTTDATLGPECAELELRAQNPPRAASHDGGDAQRSRPWVEHMRKILCAYPHENIRDATERVVKERDELRRRHQMEIAEGARPEVCTRATILAAIDRARPAGVTVDQVIMELARWKGFMPAAGANDERALKLESVITDATRLGDENKELLAENATLRRRVEKLERGGDLLDQVRRQQRRARGR